MQRLTVVIILRVIFKTNSSSYYFEVLCASVLVLIIVAIWRITGKGIHIFSDDSETSGYLLITP